METSTETLRCTRAHRRFFQQLIDIADPPLPGHTQRVVPYTQHQLAQKLDLAESTVSHHMRGLGTLVARHHKHIVVNVDPVTPDDRNASSDDRPQTDTESSPLATAVSVLATLIAQNPLSPDTTHLVLALRELTRDTPNFAESRIREPNIAEIAEKLRGNSRIREQQVSEVSKNSTNPHFSTHATSSRIREPNIAEIAKFSRETGSDAREMLISTLLTEIDIAAREAGLLGHGCTHRDGLIQALTPYTETQIRAAKAQMIRRLHTPTSGEPIRNPTGYLIDRANHNDPDWFPTQPAPPNDPPHQPDYQFSIEIPNRYIPELDQEIRDTLSHTYSITRIDQWMSDFKWRENQRQNIFAGRPPQAPPTEKPDGPSTMLTTPANN